MPAKVGIRAFASTGTARRGWCAFAHHDDVRRQPISC
jgi:PhoPQ-activated pathogenicity-related protein